jgi:hypothetical protein
MHKTIKLNWNYRFGTQGGGDLDPPELSAACFIDIASRALPAR